MSVLKFNLKNAETNKEIHMDVNVDNWKYYRTTMKIFQKSINEYLTELVNLQNTEGINAIEEENEDSDNSDDEDNKKPKRVLKPPDKIRKIKKIH